MTAEPQVPEALLEAALLAYSREYCEMPHPSQAECMGPALQAFLSHPDAKPFLLRAVFSEEEMEEAQRTLASSPIFHMRNVTDAGDRKKAALEAFCSKLSAALRSEEDPG